MKRRLFLALPLNQRFFTSLVHYADVHRRIPYLRWTAQDNLHVTVLFLGMVEEYLIPALTETLGDAFADMPSFELAFETVTYAPRHRPANMVWAQFKPHPGFDILTTQARHAAEPLVRPPERFHRARIPHCTLARFAGKVPQRPLPRLGRAGLEGEAMPVDQVVLFESRLRAAGPQYRPVETFTALNS